MTRDDPFACVVLGCHYLDADTLEGCQKRACPFTHQRRREEKADRAMREAAEDRARRETRDAGKGGGDGKIGKQGATS